MLDNETFSQANKRTPWNKGKLIGAKPPLRPKHVVGLDPKLFGTHSLRRTKATLIYRQTGNLRAV